MQEMVGGIILAGGRSSRMGRNKALLQLEPEGATLIEKVIAALRLAGVSELTIVTNTLAIYEWLNLPMVQDNFPGAGPLAGIEAGLQVSCFDFNLVVGCDMPYLQPALLQYLMVHTQHPVEAIVPLNQENQPEPLCAIYSRQILPVIRRRLQQGQYKLLGLADEIKIKYIPVNQLQNCDPNLRSFVNLNIPADLPINHQE